MKLLTTENWVIRAKFIHGTNFDYSKTKYFGTKKLLEIICNIHLESFWQKPIDHIKGKFNCPICIKNSPTGGLKLTKEEWMTKCKLKHGDEYDYLETIFNGVKRKLIIRCYEHGYFEQSAEKHFEYGCQVCAENKPVSLQEFLIRANKIHNNKFDYSLITEIHGVHSKIKIICPVHKIFEQEVNNHLSGRDCKLCVSKNKSRIEHRWLDSLNVPNDSLHRNVHIIVNNRKFIVDGIYKKEKIIFEFLGDFFHGHPILYNSEKINCISKKTFKQLFELTVNKIKYLRANGYKVICIWENKFKKQEDKIRKKIKQNAKNTRNSRKSN